MSFCKRVKGAVKAGWAEWKNPGQHESLVWREEELTKLSEDLDKRLDEEIEENNRLEVEVGNLTEEVDALEAMLNAAAKESKAKTTKKAAPKKGR